MAKPKQDRNATMAFQFPSPDDIDAVVDFYERTGVMPVNSIGPPIDRPIIPSQRPDRVGDLDFAIQTDSAPSLLEAGEDEDPEAEKVRQRLLALLTKELD